MNEENAFKRGQEIGELLLARKDEPRIAGTMREIGDQLEALADELGLLPLTPAVFASLAMCCAGEACAVRGL